MARKVPRSKVTWEPKPYQIVAVRHLVSHAHAGLLMDPGMGKTSSTLAAIDILRSKNMVRRALIVTTLRAAETVWGKGHGNEPDKWGFHFTRVFVHGPKKAELLKEDVELTIINWEALQWFCEHTAGKEWRNRWDMVVFDESTKIKNPRAKRFKAIRSILHRFKRRVILTGTIAPKNLMDLFGQIYVVDKGRALGEYITQFRRRWFTQYGYNWLPNVGAEEEIHEAIAPLCVRFGDEEQEDLQPPIYTNRYVELPDHARAKYEEMEKIFLTELESGIVTASNAGVKTSKLRQIASGGLYLPGGKDWEDLHAVKILDLAELLDELQGNPLLIAYEFKQDLSRLLQAFGKDSPKIAGGASAAEKRETANMLRRFNEGEFPFLFAQASTAAHALNLQKVCHHVCWHTMTYDLEVYHQLNKRVHRLGQKRQVVIHHQLAVDTIDEDVLKILQTKRATQARLLDALGASARVRVAALTNRKRRR
jgi:ATP:corrinoid adenosyltransferase